MTNGSTAAASAPTTASPESSSPASETGASADQGTPILGPSQFPGEDGNVPATSEPASPDQPQQRGEGDLILGRFKDYEALEADWKRQNDILRGRTSDISDESLLSMVHERGLLEDSDTVPVTPDSYDLEGAGFVTEGFDPADVQTINETLKSVGLTEEQFGVVTKLGKAAIDDSLRMFGIGRDPEFEKAELQRIWGSQTDIIGRSVLNYAAANLPRDVYMPLMRTANGVQALKTYMDMVTGQRSTMVPELGENFRGSGNARSGNVESRKAELRADPAYSNPLDPRHKQIHDEYRSLPINRRDDF